MNGHIPMTRPDLGDAEIAAVCRVIGSGWIMQGPEVAAFETEFAGAVGAPHAVAVASGTVALELALRCCGVNPGDEVATVSHSFIATANAIRAVGAFPVFVDVAEVTMGLDPERLGRALGPRTKAILAVHQLGMPCDLDRILEIAGERGLPVIEDAACALGSEIQVGGAWRRIGKPHGLVACFSFHPRKVVTTGEGGMLTTADPALADRIRRLRHHGMASPAPSRPDGPDPPRGSFVEPGFNARITDLQAALGRPQIARLDTTISARRSLARRYEAALRGNACFTVPTEPSFGRTNWQSYALGLRSGTDQAAVLESLARAGIAGQPGVGNAHQEPAYAGHRWYRCGDSPCGATEPDRCARLPVSERLRVQTVLIPLFHGMSETEQDRVIDVLARLG